jgi:PiT family inorganic phosphate transporter
MDFLTLCILLAGLFIGWNIGANDAANAIGTVVGSHIMEFKKAVLVLFIFVLIGASLQGHRNIQTVGRGIVPNVPCDHNQDCPNGNYCHFSHEENVCRDKETHEKVAFFEMDRLAVLSALLAASVFVMFITLYGMPVSTSQAIVGAVAGSGIALGVVREMDLSFIARIVMCWVLAPIASGFMAYGVYRFVLRPLGHRMSPFTFARTFKTLTIVGAAFVSYNLGANDLANSIGPIMASGIHLSLALPGLSLGSDLLIPIAVSVAIYMGASTLGWNVVSTVGKKITNLGAASAFAAQFSSAVIVYLFILFGIPVSTTQAIVGAVAGVGLTKSTRTVNQRLVRHILLGWVLTPVFAAVLSLSFYNLFKAI